EGATSDVKKLRLRLASHRAQRIDASDERMAKLRRRALEGSVEALPFERRAVAELGSRGGVGVHDPAGGVRQEHRQGSVFQHLLEQPTMLVQFLDVDALFVNGSRADDRDRGRD